MAESISQLHFLLLPYEPLGHMNPMLSLASRLAALHCRVTVVKVELKQAEVRPAPAAESNAYDDEQHMKKRDALGCDHQMAIKVVPVAGLATKAPNTASIPGEADEKLTMHVTACARLEDTKVVVEEMVKKSKTSAQPISCIVCDFFMWRWVSELAQKQDLHAAALWTSNLLSFYALFLENKRKQSEFEDVAVGRLGFPSKDDEPARYGLIGMRDPPEAREQTVKFLDSLLEGFEDSRVHLLVNSCEQLEMSIVRAFAPLMGQVCDRGEMERQLQFTMIGPCILHDDDAELPRAARRNEMERHAEAEEEENCITWLDKQHGIKKVLFVSLIGSEQGMALAEGQVEEIAMGVEERGCNPRLSWTVRLVAGKV